MFFVTNLLFFNKSTCQNLITNKYFFERFNQNQANTYSAYTKEESQISNPKKELKSKGSLRIFLELYIAFRNFATSA